MSLLDTFAIIFKTNAKEATKEIKDLDKASKDYTDSEKKRNEQIEQQKKLTQELIQNLTTVAASYLGLNAIRGGILDSAEHNTRLALTSKLTGQNAQDLETLGVALGKFGGSSEAFFSWVEGVNAGLAKQGLPMRSIRELYAEINQEMQGMSQAEKQLHLSQRGITDPAQIQFLSQTTEEYNKQIASIDILTARIAKASPAALEFASSQRMLGTAFDSVYSEIQSDVLPILTKLSNKMTDFIKENPEVSKSFTEVSAALLGVLSIVRGGQLILWVTGLGGAFTAMAASVTTAAIALGRIMPQLLVAYGAANIIVEGSSMAGSAIGHWINRRRGVGDKDGVIQPKSTTPEKASEPYDPSTPEGKNKAVRDIFGDGGVTDGYIEDFGTPIEDERGNVIGITPPKKKNAMQPLIDGKAAIDAASNSQMAYGVSGGGSSTTNVTVGDIHVQSNASDPEAVAKEVKLHLQKAYSHAISQNDNAGAR